MIGSKSIVCMLPLSSFAETGRSLDRPTTFGPPSLQLLWSFCVKNTAQIRFSQVFHHDNRYYVLFQSHRSIHAVSWLPGSNDSPVIDHCLYQYPSSLFVGRRGQAPDFNFCLGASESTEGLGFDPVVIRFAMPTNDIVFPHQVVHCGLSFTPEIFRVHLDALSGRYIHHTGHTIHIFSFSIDL